MNRWKSLVSFLVFLCLALGVIVAASAQVQFTIDATKQPSPPLRANGPFPGSFTPGHSAALPVRLELLIPTGKLRADGTILIDFIITNIGPEPITLPSSTDGNLGVTEVLTLWLTSDGTSAELYGRASEMKSVHVLAPKQTIRVHASSRVRLTPGTDLLVAHAELVHHAHGTSELIGTADSEVVIKTLSPEVPTAPEKEDPRKPAIPR